jgi:hypothetical protein
MGGAVSARVTTPCHASVNYAPSLHCQRRPRVPILESIDLTMFVQMWNVFDTAFIVVTALYLILRVKGLLSGDRGLSLIPNSVSLAYRSP